jgi:tetratricopeptide (TPR) repeat protein
MAHEVTSSSKAYLASQPPEEPRKRKRSGDLTSVEERGDAQKEKLTIPSASSSSSLQSKKIEVARSDSHPKIYANQLEAVYYGLLDVPTERDEPPLDPESEYADESSARPAQRAKKSEVSDPLSELTRLLEKYRTKDLWRSDSRTLQRLSKDLPFLTEAQSLAPSDANLKSEIDFRLAQALAGKGKLNEAIELLDLQIQHSPHSPSILYIRELAIFLRLRRNALGDAILAKCEVDEFAKLCPTAMVRGQVFKDAAIAFQKIGEIEYALAYLLKAKDEPISSEWKKKIEDLYERMAKDQEIRTLEKKLDEVSSDPDHKPHTQAELAKAYWRRNGPGDRERSKKLLQEAYEMPIQDASYKEKIGKVLAKMKSF